MIKRILLLFLPLFTYAQNSYQVIYEARQEFDRSKLKSPKQDVLAILNNSESKTYEYELIVNKTNSYFKKVDKIDNSQKNGGISFGISSVAGANIFKVLNEGFFYEEDMMTNKLFIKDSLIKFQWEITDETKDILGYKVQKAIYVNPNQTVEAWFAPELSFSDGPTKFSGLPGLILEVKFKIPFVSDLDTNIIYQAIAIKEYIGKIELPKNSKIVAKEVRQKELQENQNRYSTIKSGVERN